MSKREEVLKLWFKIHDHLPVDWHNKQSIKTFSAASDFYAKSWLRLDNADQGWVCEQISNHHKTTRAS